MNTIAVTSAESVLSGRHSQPEISPEGGIGTVMIATMDASVHRMLAQILEGHGIDVVWVKGLERAQEFLRLGTVAACLCGFGLEEGSYKELVKFAKREVPETPVVIVSTPSCANEYAEYLAAMNAGAFDFLCYPYQKREVDRILRLAVSSSLRHLR
jgi:DNA-binding NtrC family response regulator